MPQTQNKFTHFSIYDKLHKLSFEEKISIIKKLYRGESPNDVSIEFALSKSCIDDIQNDMELILKFARNHGIRKDLKVPLTLFNRKRPKLKRIHLDRYNPCHTVIRNIQREEFTTSNQGSSEKPVISITVDPMQNNQISLAAHESVEGKNVVKILNFEDKTPGKNRSHDWNEEEVLMGSTYQEYIDNFSDYECKTHSNFIITRSDKTFRGEDSHSTNVQLVQWGSKGMMKDMPYIAIGSEYYSCHLGRNNDLKKAARESRRKHELGIYKRYFNKKKGSKKLGCPVKIRARRLLLFPELQAPCWLSYTEEERNEIKNFIKVNRESLPHLSHFACNLPSTSKHEFHVVGSAANDVERIDKRVFEKIYSIVLSGKTRVDDISKILEHYVINELKVEDRDRRRFFPDKSTLAKAIYRGKIRARENTNEFEKLETMIANLGNTEEVFLRTFPAEAQNSANCYKVPEDMEFLFVYQTHHMKRLFSLYGGNCVFLDAVGKSCEFPLALYFMVVQTNVSYQVVAFFILQFDSKRAITEALRIVEMWNPLVTPKYGFVINSPDEVKALETVYPDIKVFFSDSHRELEWLKKIKNISCNSSSAKVELFEKLKEMAASQTEEQFKNCFLSLKSAKGYDLIKGYYYRFWHVHYKRWVIAYRPTDLLFNINGGPGRINSDLKYDFLKKYNSKPLSQAVKMLTDDYIPQKVLSYAKENLEPLSKYKLQANNLAPYLIDRPGWFIDHILFTQVQTMEETDQYYVQYVAENEFLVLSEGSNTCHEVNFFPNDKWALCNCIMFIELKLICKHMLLIGAKFPEWNLTNISFWLFDNPLFKLDPKAKQIEMNLSFVEPAAHPSIQTSLDPTLWKENNSNDEDEKEREILTSNLKMELLSLGSLSAHMTDDQLRNLYEAVKLLNKSKESIVTINTISTNHSLPTDQIFFECDETIQEAVEVKTESAPLEQITLFSVGQDQSLYEIHDIQDGT